MSSSSTGGTRSSEHYRRLIYDYQTTLHGINVDLQRQPQDQSLQQMKELYMNRVDDTHRKLQASLDKLHDHERELRSRASHSAGRGHYGYQHGGYAVAHAW